MKAIPKERIILGIDPGTSMTGYGVIKATGNVPELIAIGAIDLSHFDDHYVKLKHIFERTAGIIDEYHPDDLAIEAHPQGHHALWNIPGQFNTARQFG